MAEQKTEDIIDRLEALRKRVPEETGPTAEEPPAEEGPEDPRKKKARIVGIFVVLLIVVGVFGAAYKFVLQPRTAQSQVQQQEAQAQEQARQEEERQRLEQERQAFINAKSEKSSEIKAAFQGLPPAYATAKSELENNVNSAQDITAVQAIDAEEPATEAWRTYRLDQVEAKLETVAEIELKLGDDVYRSVPEIKQKIQSLSFTDLKDVIVRELKYEYVPMWGTRQQGVYFPEENMIVNVYYRTLSNESVPTSPYETRYLAKDAKVISVLRAESSGEIDLSESETRLKTGGGVEGVGTVPTLSIGGSSASLTGTFTGSAGTASSETQTTLTVDLGQVQKAYAAGKISESDFNKLMDQYGMRLDDIEESTGFGEFDVEYLILVRVTAEEAPGLVLRLYTPEDRTNIYMTFTSRSSS